MKPLLQMSSTNKVYHDFCRKKSLLIDKKKFTHITKNILTNRTHNVIFTFGKGRIKYGCRL